MLVSATDGVGTKLLVARATGRYGTVGIDLVAMCVDDLVCSGAEPLFFLDYVAVGRLVPERIEEVVAGVADGCRQAGCALIGGETAEHPGAMADDDLDLAGFAVGVVERGRELGPDRVRPGDVLIGLPSPGPAVQRLLPGPPRAAGAGRPGSRRAGLVRRRRTRWPTSCSGRRSSTPPAVLAAVASARPRGEGGGVHACAHITGGGIPGNLVRVLPAGCDARLDRRGWETPRIFGEIARLGEVAEDEMARVFNLGLGMVLVVDQQAGEAVLAALSGAGHTRWWWAPSWRERERWTCDERRRRGRSGRRGGAAADRVRRAAGPPADAFGAPGDFVLKSGKRSSWFIDSKQTVCRPEAMLLVADAVLSVVPDDATAIGGLTMGADPVAFVTAGVAATRGRR